MRPTRKGEGDHKAWMVLREGGLTLLDVHLYMKQIFLSISEDILVFFASHLFYCFLEEIWWRDRGIKNFMRFGSSSMCLFSYHAFILMRHLNIACLLFKYFDLTGEAFSKIGIHSMQGWIVTTRYVLVNSRLEAI